MNKLGIDLQDRVVRLKDGRFAKVFGGFGVKPDVGGSALYAMFGDSDTTDIRDSVDRVATDKEAEEFEASIYDLTERRLLHDLEAAQIKADDAKKTYNAFVALYRYNKTTNRMEEI